MARRGLCAGAEGGGDPAQAWVLEKGDALGFRRQGLLGPSPPAGGWVKALTWFSAGRRGMEVARAWPSMGR